MWLTTWYRRWRGVKAQELALQRENNQLLRRLLEHLQIEKPILRPVPRPATSRKLTEKDVHRMTRADLIAQRQKEHLARYSRSLADNLEAGAEATNLQTPPRTSDSLRSGEPKPRPETSPSRH